MRIIGCALLLLVAYSQLDETCTQGDYYVDGHDTGKAVVMNYTSSRIHKESDVTYLDADFIVPSMYFYNPQNVSGVMYDRSVQITFHQRLPDTTQEVQDACYTTRSENGSEYCARPSADNLWTAVEDGCDTKLRGKLEWDKMMRHDWHDSSRILITEANRTINGFDTPTWEVFMMAIIETWVGFEEQSTTVRDQFPDRLIINTERYSYYEIPFRISFPQKITLVARQIRVSAPMVTLFAVVEQEIIDINFNPQNGENFGRVQLTIVTQTQFPFALRNFSDPLAPALIRTTDDSKSNTTGNIDGDPEWVSAENPDTCFGSVTANAPNNLCEQRWTFIITPQLCDVTGDFQMEAWAICFDDSEGCPLDMLAPSQLSNTWTGMMDFSVAAQNFCPQVIDEILVKGYITPWADEQYSIGAVPGENVFSNDYIWFEVTYKTKSTSAERLNGVTWEQGDDSLIEYVRPYNIEMRVEMDTAPLQTEVNRDNGDVDPVTESLIYTITLCTATPQTFPYTQPFVDDCFDPANKGWNALNYLDFQESVNNLGSNTIDANEIGFKLRLDERVIPVDLPNDPAYITVMVDSEVYYHGNDNPVNRRELKTYRRKLQVDVDTKQHVQAQTSFNLPTHRQMSYCVLNYQRTTVGFALDATMDSSLIPNAHSAHQHAIAMRYSMVSYFHASVDEIEFVAIATCDSANCKTIWNGEDLNGRRALQDARYVRYYITVSNIDLANRIQEEFYHHGAIEQSEAFKDKMVRDMKVDHCDDALSAFFSGDVHTPGQDVPAVDSSSSTFVVMFALMTVLFLTF